DFWGLAAFFTNVRMEAFTREGKAQLMQAVHEGVAVPNRKNLIPPITNVAEIEIPESNGKITAARFLDGKAYVPSSGPAFRPALADWVTEPSNAMFTRAAANRMWAHFFGRGLVEPVDDMRPENACTHPALLELLGSELISCNFDLKHLVRGIVNSQAYQR